MRTYNSNYIDGEFQPVSVAMISNSVLAGVGLAAGYIPSKSLSPALTTQHIPLVNPTSERLEGHCAISNTETVNSAVQAAKRAQKAYSKTSLVQRASYLDSILRECQKREEDFAQVLHRQIGCPLQVSLSLRFKGLLLYTNGILFNLECSSSIMLYNVTSIAYNH